MNIIVSTSATNASGALSIYRQFLAHLRERVGDDRYYLFIDPSMDRPPISGVTYIEDANRSWFHRILWDNYLFKKWVKKSGVNPDVIVSLQNTGVNYPVPQIVYYHNPFPLYERNWNPLKRSERTLFLYKGFYPFFVKHSLRRDTQVVVQAPFLKDLYVKKYRHPSSMVHAMCPDIMQIDVDSVEAASLEKDCVHFLYPATAWVYKNHLWLVSCMNLLKKQNAALCERIRIHFTLEHGERADLEREIKDSQLEKQFIFDGKLSQQELFSMYKASNGLLFPSEIETLGLPLQEAASFGLPIVVTDLPYAHNAMQGYEGARYVQLNKDAWCGAIEQMAEKPQKFAPTNKETKESSWNEFFNLITNKSKNNYVNI